MCHSHDGLLSLCLGPAVLPCVCRDLPGAPEDSMGVWEHSYLYSKVLAPIVVILPLWWRFMQCLRRYHDTNQRWPHLANATKYAMAQVRFDTKTLEASTECRACAV